MSVSRLTVGSGVWLPCKVKPGPFGNERMVLVEVNETRWFGFVNEQWLYKKVESGDDHVLGKVRRVEGDTFYAMIPGNAPAPSLISDSVSGWTRVDDSLKARHTAGVR